MELYEFEPKFKEPVSIDISKELLAVDLYLNNPGYKQYINGFYEFGTGKIAIAFEYYLRDKQSLNEYELDQILYYLNYESREFGRLFMNCYFICRNVNILSQLSDNAEFNKLIDKITKVNSDFRR